MKVVLATAAGIAFGYVLRTRKDDVVLSIPIPIADRVIKLATNTADFVASHTK